VTEHEDRRELLAKVVQYCAKTDPKWNELMHLPVCPIITYIRYTIKNYLRNVAKLNEKLREHRNLPWYEETPHDEGTQHIEESKDERDISESEGGEESSETSSEDEPTFAHCELAETVLARAQDSVNEMTELSIQKPCYQKNDVCSLFAQTYNECSANCGNNLIQQAWL